MSTTLDGITLLRYAHIYRNRTSGGAEQYLKQLNDGLLARHRMKILQMHLVNDDAALSPSAMEVEVETRGLGQIIWIPVRRYNEERSVRSLPRRVRLLALQRAAATATGQGAGSSTIRRALGNSCGHLRYSTMILSEGLADILEKYRVDLIALHWFSYDVGTLVSTAVKRRIPYAMINHFDNSRFSEKRTLRWVEQAAALGGVSNRNVPSGLEGHYVNLSDAVDVDFFSPSRSKQVRRPEGFVVLLPGRLVAGKGHADLLLAAKNLLETGVNLSVVFAGVVESVQLEAELKKKVTLWGMRDQVLFLGQLNPEALRDWYAASDVVVLPSSSEGLPRVLIEAQAMEKPVIAYNCGGMPEALFPYKTGFLVNRGDYAALGERVQHLLDNPTERFVMGKTGREFVLERFSVSSLIERHERFYCNALSGRPSHSL
jgi:glycosyltransferase involved in cell wall biosynthesis